MVETAMKASRNSQKSRESILSSRRTPRDLKHSSRVTSRRTVSQKSNDVISDEEYETEEEQIAKLKATLREFQVSSEYIQASRLLKYAKIGNPTATVLALLALDDLGMEKDAVQACIYRLSGITLLINLLKSNDLRSKTASLKIMSQICTNKVIAAEVINGEGIEVLVGHLTHKDIRVAVLTAETLSLLAILRIGRNLIRSSRGLETLLTHLNYASQFVKAEDRKGTTSRRQTRPQTVPVGVPPLLVRATAQAVWYCCRSSINRQMVIHMDIAGHLEKLLSMRDPDLAKPVVGIINYCSEESVFRKRVLEEGVVQHLIDNLKSPDAGTQLIALQALEKCLVEPDVRNEVQKINGLPYILALLQKSKQNRAYVDLLAASTGAILGCMTDNNVNINWFCRENIVEKVTPLLEDQPVKIVSNALGILKVIAQRRLDEVPHLTKDEILAPIMRHLQDTDEKLLVPTNETAGEFAKHSELREELIQRDALRLLWSELKSSKTKVIASAANAIYYIVEDQEETADLVRSLVGGIELLLKLLRSEEKEILAPVCHVISRLVLDNENLTIMDDYDLPIILQQLINKDDLSVDVILALCRCLQNCCANEQQRIKLRATIKRVGQWLSSSNPLISKEATHALHKMSNNSDNCLVIYQHGVVKHLMSLICSDDEELQENAAMCLRNIRCTIVQAAEGSNKSSAFAI